MGTAFLKELLGHSNDRVEIVAVAELCDTPGLALAREHGIENLRIDDLIAMGSKLNILFDLTGEEEVRHEIRDKLKATGNHHTIVATDNIARMIWALIASGAEMPSTHSYDGY